MALFEFIYEQQYKNEGQISQVFFTHCLSETTKEQYKPNREPCRKKIQLILFCVFSIWFNSWKGKFNKALVDDFQPHETLIWASRYSDVQTPQALSIYSLELCGSNQLCFFCLCIVREIDLCTYSVFHGFRS